MNTAPADNPEFEELDKAMEPFMTLPVATPQMILTLAHHLISKRKDTETRREPSTPSAASWMNVTQLAAHFGYHRVTMHRILANCLETGKVRYIQPKGTPTQKGESNRRYSVADVTAALMKETTKAGKASA